MTVCISQLSYKRYFDTNGLCKYTLPVFISFTRNGLNSCWSALKDSEKLYTAQFESISPKMAQLGQYGPPRKMLFYLQLAMLIFSHLQQHPPAPNSLFGFSDWLCFRTVCVKVPFDTNGLRQFRGPQTCWNMPEANYKWMATNIRLPSTKPTCTHPH